MIQKSITPQKNLKLVYRLIGLPPERLFLRQRAVTNEHGR